MSTSATNLSVIFWISSEPRRSSSSEISVKPEDKTNWLGLVGSLEDEEIRQLLKEVLTPVGNLMVTPKEIDFVIEKLSDVIGNGINLALHQKKML